MSKNKRDSAKHKLVDSDLSNIYQEEWRRKMDKYQSLRDLDLFVLDNSLRESTVAQLRSHTIENKREIYREIKECGFGNYIVAAFSHMTRVDDVFVRELVKTEDRDTLWAFSEVTEGVKDGVPDMESIPTGLRKMKEVGLYNVVLEADLGDAIYDFSKFSVDAMCQLINKWVVWIRGNLNQKAKIVVNVRDLPDFMPTDSDRLFQLLGFLAKLPEKDRIFGFLFEEPRGTSLPEEMALWTKFTRKIMNDNNWKGKLLVHVHEKFGLCDTAALKTLMNGADGVWASLIKEGAAMGHASSIVTILNLIRLGNKKVLERYNCVNLRKAAIRVTELTTGRKPMYNQVVYGERALDFVFDMNPEQFDLAAFFGEEAPCRITTLASPGMIRTRLENLFGEDPQFTDEIAYKMKECMLEDLRANRKEEYMSKFGLAILFDRAGGSLTAQMRDVITSGKLESVHAQKMIDKIRAEWDEWDLKDHVQGDDMLQFDNFYNGFMAPYFGCYRCEPTKQAIKALDMDADGYVDWNEFKVYLMWAARQYPNCRDKKELLDIAFRKGLIPAMRDEAICKAKTKA